MLWSSVKKRRTWLHILTLLSMVTFVLLMIYYVPKSRDSRLENVNAEITTKTSKTKIILLWTSWYGISPSSVLLRCFTSVFHFRFGNKQWMKSLNFDKGYSVFLQNSLGAPSCVATTNRSQINNAHALVFHAKNVEHSDLPSVRYQWQKYVLLNMEPLESLKKINWNVLSDVKFNRTMGYYSKQDYFLPYWKTSPLPLAIANDVDRKHHIEEKIFGFVNGFHTREKDAVWIVSHCM